MSEAPKRDTGKVQQRREHPHCGICGRFMEMDPHAPNGWRCPKATYLYEYGWEHE